MDPEQEDELLDVVDEQDRVIGAAGRRDIHEQGLLHRAVHVFVVDQQQGIYLQKRAWHKDEHPGKWDSSASGHVDSGESYPDAARREQYATPAHVDGKAAKDTPEQSGKQEQAASQQPHPTSGTCDLEQLIQVLGRGQLLQGGRTEKRFICHGCVPTSRQPCKDWVTFAALVTLAGSG